MDLYSESINEADLAQKISIFNANIGDVPDTPEELYRISRESSKKIRRILMYGGISTIVCQTQTQSLYVSLVVAVIWFYFTLKESVRVSQVGEDIVLDNRSGYYKEVLTQTFPLIKSSVDAIIINGEKQGATDIEIAIAVTRLKNFFLQHNWNTHLTLAKGKASYIGYWERIPFGEE